MATKFIFRRSSKSMADSRTPLRLYGSPLDS